MQRVDDKHELRSAAEIAGFETRRVNFTFRYVPDEHVVAVRRAPPAARDDVRGYVAELATHSEWFADALADAPTSP